MLDPLDSDDVNVYVFWVSTVHGDAIVCLYFV